MSTWAPTLTWCALLVIFAALSNVWNGHDPGWYASLALGWAYSFYVPHSLVGAAACLAGAAVLTWVLLVGGT